MIGSIAVYALVGSLALLGVFSEAAIREERAAFEALARANAAFLDHSSLPRSAQMAAQLSTVTGAQVFFKHASTGTLVGDATAEVIPLAVAAAADGKTHEHASLWLVARTLQDGSRVYFVRNAPLRTASLERTDTWVAVLAFWLLALGLGAWLARRIATPMQVLARALPSVGTDSPLPALPCARTDEIGQLARVLKTTHEALIEERGRRRASERLALLGRMAASLAHEVRNPIAAIKLHTQLLEGATPTEADASRALIEAEAERIESLVQQWLHFAKPAPPVLLSVDLHALVQAAIQSAEPLAQHANATIHCAAPTAPVLIAADSHRIHQALTNVINNAIQAMPRGGSLQVRVLADTAHCSVAIEDSGPGFSSTALHRLAEPFYSEKEGGMGLGLAVTREICRAHGGDLQVSATASGGACVTLSFATQPPVAASP